METPKFDEAKVIDQIAKSVSNGKEGICKDYQKFSEKGGKAALLGKFESQLSIEFNTIKGFSDANRQESLNKTHAIMYKAIDSSTGNSPDVKQSMRNLTDEFVLSMSDGKLTDNDIQETLNIFMRDAEKICGI